MSDVTRYFRAARAEDIQARKGQQIIAHARGIVSGRVFETRADGSGAQRIAANVGIMFRFRRSGTLIYDSYVADKEAVDIDNKSVFADGAAQFVAKFDYDNVEIAPFVEHGPLSDGYTTAQADRLSLENIEADVVVSDYVSNSNG